MSDTAAEPKTKDARSFGVIQIEQATPDGGWAQVAKEHFETMAKAEKWVRDNGEHGNTYRIIREARVMQVRIKSLRKATFE